MRQNKKKNTTKDTKKENKNKQEWTQKRDLQCRKAFFPLPILVISTHPAHPCRLERRIDDMPLCRMPGSCPVSGRYAVLERAVQNQGHQRRRKRPKRSKRSASLHPTKLPSIALARKPTHTDSLVRSGIHPREQVKGQRSQSY
jgi:hypothetical protein